jgi:hypothetical protein
LKRAASTVPLRTDPRLVVQLGLAVLFAHAATAKAAESARLSDGGTLLTPAESQRAISVRQDARQRPAQAPKAIAEMAPASRHSAPRRDLPCFGGVVRRDRGGDDDHEDELRHR